MSVRALHHYDEIGLLSPSLRTPSGHRLYQQADIARLQQIQSLRLMGIPLEEVKQLLDGAAMSPREVIDLHLARLHEQIALQNSPGRAPRRRSQAIWTGWSGVRSMTSAKSFR